MKLKDKHNKTGSVVQLPSQNDVQIPVAYLVEMPRFYCKHHNLWNFFEFADNKERKQVEDMTLEEARQADMADNEAKVKSLTSVVTTIKKEEVNKDAQSKN